MVSIETTESQNLWSTDTKKASYPTKVNEFTIINNLRNNLHFMVLIKKWWISIPSNVRKILWTSNELENRYVLRAVIFFSLSFTNCRTENTKVDCSTSKSESNDNFIDRIKKKSEQDKIEKLIDKNDDQNSEKNQKDLGKSNQNKNLNLKKSTISNTEIDIVTTKVVEPEGILIKMETQKSEDLDVQKLAKNFSFQLEQEKKEEQKFSEVSDKKDVKHLGINLLKSRFFKETMQKVTIEDNECIAMQYDSMQACELSRM